MKAGTFVKAFSFILVFIAPFLLCAQCIQGDCQNGIGKYDFGYGVYVGEFKNGLPHGKGTMDYGEGEKFTGNFLQGRENGVGLLWHKDGSCHEVDYVNGSISRKANILTVGTNPAVEGCVTGNCYTGYGELKFPGGNIYKGEFKNGQRQGRGAFFFASGNIFEGQFVNNYPDSGRFTYAKERMLFKGFFYNDGSPKTGIYLYPENESSIEIKDNTIVNITNAAGQAEAAKKMDKCIACNGKGITGSESTYSYTTAGTYTMSQFGQGRINLTNPETHTSKGRTFYNVCNQCKGKGQVVRK